MKIPNRVKIGAHTYKIVFRDDMDDDKFGLCNTHKGKIFVDETAIKTQQEDTFFHEVMHEAGMVVAEPQHVMHDQHLCISTWAGANTNDWNTQFFADIRGQFSRDTLEYQ